MHSPASLKLPQVQDVNTEQNPDPAGVQPERPRPPARRRRDVCGCVGTGGTRRHTGVTAAGTGWGWGPWAVGLGEAPEAGSRARAQPALKTAASGWRPAVRRTGRPTVCGIKPFPVEQGSNKDGFKRLRPCPPAAAGGPARNAGSRAPALQTRRGCWGLGPMSQLSLAQSSRTRRGQGRPGGQCSLSVGGGRGQCGCWVIEDRSAPRGPAPGATCGSQGVPTAAQYAV